MSKPYSDPNFDYRQSLIKDVYEKFSCKDPVELSDLYYKEDQRLMREILWDHRNDKLLTNQIKDAIEKAGGRNITDKDELLEISDILWLWYHHAIGTALWLYGDKEEAQKFSAEALTAQTFDNPNQITRLFYYLTRDDLEKAEEWLGDITNKSEKDLARGLIDFYKAGNFFEIQSK